MPGLAQSQSVTQTQMQTMSLSPQAQQSLRILAMPTTELRAELQREIAQNPVIEDMVDSMTVPLSDVQDNAARERFDDGAAFDGWDVRDSDNYAGRDEEAQERRDRFFNSRIAPISLRDHLLAQLALENMSPRDKKLAAKLIDDIDERGRFTGSIPDYEMTTGRSAEEITAILNRISAFDPDPQPGMFYDSSRIGYVKPEVHLLRCTDGSLKVTTDTRTLPDIRISPSYLRMLENPRTDPATRTYLLEKVRAAEALRDAIANRDETVRRIAQEIVATQGDYLTRKADHLSPLTMREIAEKVGVHETTVSRTVRNKWMSTPRGTVELHSLFASPNNAIPDRIRAIIGAEDAARPLSDQAITDRLKAEGVEIARRTVAKYREQLKIPGAAERRKRRT